jgi:TatD DNase family protein
MFIDTHAHIDSQEYEGDLEEVIERALESNVKYILDPATDIRSVERVLSLADRYDSVFACVGIHPHDAKDVNNQVLDEIEKLSYHKKVLAIGEIGLDFHYDYSQKSKQAEVFSAFVDLAVRRDLPIVVHSRESDKRIVELIESNLSEKVRGQFHCFSGDMTTAKRVMELGFHISFTGNITFTNSRSAEILNQIPLDRLLLETDSPYMSPVPYRGKRNEPCRAPLIARKIAEVKSLDLDQVARVTSENANRLFRFQK